MSHSIFFVMLNYMTITKKKKYSFNFQKYDHGIELSQKVSKAAKQKHAQTSARNTL